MRKNIGVGLRGPGFMTATVMATVLVAGCAASAEQGAEDTVAEGASGLSYTWPTVDGGIRNATSSSSSGSGSSSSSSVSTTIDGAEFCGGVIPKWEHQHVSLLIAMVRAGIPVNRTTLLSGSPIQLAASQASKDAGYKVRGMLEQIDANTTSRDKLNAVLARLPAGATAAIGPLLDAGVNCNGASVTLEGGGKLFTRNYGSKSPEAKPVLDAFHAVSNRLLNYDADGTATFDPTTSPDGFGSVTSSGSCSTYGSAIKVSTDQWDSRFVSNCNAETGEGCVACNLDGEAGCTSRVVWRRVGSSSAWRCRSL